MAAEIHQRSEPILRICESITDVHPLNPPDACIAFHARLTDRTAASDLFFFGREKGAFCGESGMQKKGTNAIAMLGSSSTRNHTRQLASAVGP